MATASATTSGAAAGTEAESKATASVTAAYVAAEAVAAARVAVEVAMEAAEVAAETAAVDLAAADMVDIQVNVDVECDAPHVRYTLYCIGGAEQLMKARMKARDLSDLCRDLERHHGRSLLTKFFIHSKCTPMVYFMKSTQPRVMPVDSVNEAVVMAAHVVTHHGRATKACRAGAGAEEEEE